MTGGRAGRRRIPVAVISVALLGGLLGGGSAGRPVPAQAGAGARDVGVVSILKSVRELRAGLDSVAATVVLLREQIARARGGLVQVQRGIREAETTLHARDTELERRVDAVRAAISWEGPPLAVSTMADLRAPLVIVSGALHGADALAVELLSQQEAMRARALAVNEIETDLRSTRSSLAGQERTLGAHLAAARQSIHALGGLSGVTGAGREASAVVEEALVELNVLGVAEEELRELEGQARRLATAVVEGQEKLRGRVREVRRATRALHEDMVAAESLVAARLAVWGGPLGESGEPSVNGVFGICPVDEPRAYSDDWGAPRWSGGFHLHQGIDIFAPPGTPIRAPFPGTAVAWPNLLGGKAVKVYGAAGYVYNAHLSEYGALGEVSTGTVIGYVGNTGNAVATAPHNHFEWHPGNGDAVNPFPYLNAVC